MKSLSLAARRAGAVLVPPWADRNLKVVLAARAGMSVGRAAVSVVTALYLATIGFSGVQIGALFVVVTLASALLSTTIGLLADRWGRKPFLVVVPLVTAVAAVTYASSRDTAVLVLAAAVGSFGRGAGAGGGSVGPYQPAESALVTDIVEPVQRATAFGRLAFASTLGAMIGGLSAGLVRTTPHMSPADVTAAYRPVFLLAGALAVVAGLLALLLHEQPRSAQRAQTRRKVRWPRHSWPALWRFWLTNAANGAGIGLFGPFVSYWFFRRYDATPAAIGALFAVVNLASLASPLVASGVARRLGTVRAIVTIRAVGGILLVPLALAPGFWVAGGIYLVRMMVQRIGMPLRQSFTQDMADPEERASVAALSNLPAQGTMAAGQAGGGWLFDEVSLAAPFTLAAVFQVSNAVLYWLLFSRHPPHRSTTPEETEPRPPADEPPGGAQARVMRLPETN